MSDIKVSQLYKSFDDLKVLRGVDFSIQPGECVILLGANGSGKSTLMRCLNGLSTPDQGRIEIGGHDVVLSRGRKLRHVRRRIGTVFQQFNLVDNVSVFQNVIYGALGRRPGGLLTTLPAFAPSDLREEAMRSLDRVGLSDYASKQCRDLSGGQKQRVAIARTLVQKPDVVLADEPIASLDPRAGRAVMDLLVETARMDGMTVLCSLHQLELASEYGDRVLGMKAGGVEIDAARTSLSRAQMEGLYRGVVRVDETHTDGGTASAAASA